jgi:hypothetical protein
MRIIRVELLELSLPLVEPFVISGGTMHERRSLVVVLHDETGHRGYGESPPFELPFYSDETLAGARHLLQHVLIPRVVGLEFEWSHADPEVKVEARYDAATEVRRIIIVRTHHGTPHASAIDADFLASGDAAQIRAAADVLQDLVHPGAVVKRGEKQQAVKSFKEALDWLLGEARGSVAIQRYKGLGEMNPGQLWETTMDPAVRRLLRVQIEDAITSDNIFSTLMGELVEPRRDFIETNALGVRNLDV